MIAEVENEELLVHGVFAEKTVDTEDVIKAFGSTIKKVTLGFTPADVTGYICELVQEEDRNFFVQ